MVWCRLGDWISVTELFFVEPNTTLAQLAGRILFHLSKLSCSYYLTMLRYPYRKNIRSPCLLAYLFTCFESHVQGWSGKYSVYLPVSGVVTNIEHNGARGGPRSWRQPAQTDRRKEPADAGQSFFGNGNIPTGKTRLSTR